MARERLGPLYEEVGDDAKAIEAYSAFADAWAEADPDMQPRVRHARDRAAQHLPQRAPVDFMDQLLELCHAPASLGELHTEWGQRTGFFKLPRIMTTLRGNVWPDSPLG